MWWSRSSNHLKSAKVKVRYALLSFSCIAQLAVAVAVTMAVAVAVSGHQRPALHPHRNCSHLKSTTSLCSLVPFPTRATPTVFRFTNNFPVRDSDRPDVSLLLRSSLPGTLPRKVGICHSSIRHGPHPQSQDMYLYSVLVLVLPGLARRPGKMKSGHVPFVSANRPVWPWELTLRSTEYLHG
jgi:hypothetical protein